MTERMMLIVQLKNLRRMHAHETVGSLTLQNVSLGGRQGLLVVFDLSATPHLLTKNTFDKL